MFQKPVPGPNTLPIASAVLHALPVSAMLGSRAAVAILEHRWAIGLRDALLAAGAHGLVDAWIHPSDLVGLGAEMALEAEAESEAGTGSPA